MAVAPVVARPDFPGTSRRGTAARAAVEPNA